MEAGNLYVRFGVDVSALKSGLAEAKGALSRFGSDMQSVGTTLTTAVSIPLAAAGGWAIKLAGQLEATALSFRVLTKDASAALMIQKQLNDYADKSPFSSEDVTMAGKRLVAYRFAVKDVLPYLKDAGDLAAAFADQGVKVADTAAVFGRLKSGDFGEAFERLRDFGISRELLEGKGLKFDKSGEYKGSVQQALAAVRAIIQENYGGMADALGTTLPGMLATAKDTIERFAQDIGKALVENFDVKQLIGDFTNFVNGLRESFNNLSPAAQKFALTLGALAVALPPIALAIGSVVTAMPVLAAGFAAVTGPIGLASAAVVLLAANWDTVKQKAYEALYSMGKWAGEALVKLGEKVGSQTLVNEGKAQLAKSASFRGTYLPQQSGASVVGDQSLAEDIREAKKPITNPFKAVTQGAQDAAKAAKEVTKALLEASDARIKAGLDAIKFREADNKHGITSGTDVYKMAPIRDVKYSKANNLFPDLSNAINMKALGDTLQAASDYAVEVLKQGELRQQLEQSAADLKGAFSSLFDGWNVAGMRDTVKEALASIGDMSQDMLDKLNSLTKLMPSIAGALTAGFEAIGAAMVNGKNPFEAFGKSILGSFGAMLISIGQEMLKQSAALLALAIATGGAVSPIAIRTGIAGAALVTTGGAIKAATSKRSYASGWGGAYGPTNMIFGDHAGRSVDNPEYVLRHDQVKSILNRAADNAGGGRGGFVAETVIRGADLRVLLKRAETQASN